MYSLLYVILAWVGFLLVLPHKLSKNEVVYSSTSIILKVNIFELRYKSS